MSVHSTPILLYHHVTADEPSPPPRFAGNYVTVSELRAQLDDLARREISTRTLASLVGAPKSEGRSIVLTFDDGCECFRARVLPELSKRRMTATVFAVAGRLGDRNRWDEAAGERRERLMDAAALRELLEAGVEVGCHSLTHRDLTTLEQDELRREVTTARSRLGEALGVVPTTFCYPYGRFDSASRSTVEEAGFTAAVSVWGYPGATRRDPLALPRVGIDPGDGRAAFRIKSSAAYPWLRRLPRVGVLSALRRTPGVAEEVG